MEDIDEEGDEELLNLSLAIVTNSAHERMKKRKRRDNIDNSDLSSSTYESSDGKIFRLLQMREQMLKLDHKKKRGGRGGNNCYNDNNIYDPVGDEDGKGLQVIRMLLITATAVNENNVSSALENLAELYKSVSLCGDSVQRVVAYFADVLAARLLTRESPFYDMISKEPTYEEEFVAFTALYKVSPYYQFAHFTANQAIIEAFEKEEDKNNRSLHVIDFDVSYGFQWPSLIQSLSEKGSSGSEISLKITGFGRSLDELRETENRLLHFSKGCRNLVFEFQGLLHGSNLINLRRKRNETIAVNLVFHLNSLNNNMKISDSLKSVHLLNPSIVMLVEQEGSRSPRSFLSRFMESLHYFAAMFDSLDDCLPLESAERLNIEKNHLGKEIKSMLNYENIKEDHRKTEKSTETWKARMESHGFEGINLSSKSKIQARLLLKIRTHYSPLQFEEESSTSTAAGFRVFERDDGRTLSLGWQDRYLLTVSAWHCHCVS
ncbi:GRAS family protein RAM1-like [Argentina anserina]|uniref:GRAS family protein RAM1-like n=1 Tax=Argentina anserina TaxID=57926 RepID=UPI0021768D27|nr:GRAS family protein RAM1-like [Potentilla anserina]